MSWSQEHISGKVADQDMRHGINIWRVILAGALMSFSSFISVRIIIYYMVSHFGLSTQGVENIYSIFYMIIGVGQFIMAIIADRYLGSLRVMRLGMIVAFVSVLGFTWLLSWESRALVYQGQQYDIILKDDNIAAYQYAVVGGKELLMTVQVGGALHIRDSQGTALPEIIPASQWHFESRTMMDAPLLIMILTSLYMATRCFGMSLFFSVLGSLYQQRDNARVMGFTIAYIFMNFVAFLAIDGQFGLVQFLGRKMAMAFAALSLVLAYAILHGARDDYAHVPGLMLPAQGHFRPHIYKILSIIPLSFFLIMLCLWIEARPALIAGDVSRFIPNIERNGEMLLALSVGGLLYFVIQAHRHKNAPDFYAILCVAVLCLLRLIYDCMATVGGRNFDGFAYQYVNLDLWYRVGLNHQNLLQIDALSIFFIGGGILFVWSKIQHNFVPMNELVKSFIAFAIVAAAYMILSIGAHHLDSRQLMPFGYFILPAMMIPLAELLITPALMAGIYRLRSHNMPTTALAMFTITMTISPMISNYYAQITGIPTVVPASKDMAATQLAYSNVFLNTGTLGLVGAIFLLFAVLPLFTRWIARAAPAAKPRLENPEGKSDVS